jgi:hypothetical protein
MLVAVAVDLELADLEELAALAAAAMVAAELEVMELTEQLILAAEAVEALLQEDGAVLAELEL